MSLVQLEYGFILSHLGVSTVVGGFSGIKQLDETVAAAGNSDVHPEEIMNDIQRI